MAEMNAATLAEIKRKASLGIALTNSSNASNNAVYNQTRSAADAEIARKANAGIALSNTGSAYNTKMYNDLVNAKNKPIVTPAAASAAPGANSLIDGLAEARRTKALADLGKARDNSLSNLGAEKSAIQPKYYDAKNQTAAGSQQQARNFAEFMAARGGTGAGSNAQAELTRGMTLQGNLGSLGRQEAADYSDIERRTSGLQNAYESDVASTNAGIEADSMQALLNDYYQQQQRELQIAELMGSYNGNSTLAKQNQQWGQTVDKANLTGTYNGQKTAAQAQQEWNNRFNYGNAIGQFSNGQQTLQNQQFQYTQGRDMVADQQWEDEFKRIQTQDGIQNALSWASHNLNVSQENRVAANQASSGSGGSSGSSSSKPSKESTIHDINMPRTASSMETYIIKNLPGGANVFGPPSPAQTTLIESMILDNPNLSEADMVKLYKKFGIPLPE